MHFMAADLDNNTHFTYIVCSIFCSQCTFSHIEEALHLQPVYISCARNLCTRSKRDQLRHGLDRSADACCDTWSVQRQCRALDKAMTDATLPRPMLPQIQLFSSNFLLTERLSWISHSRTLLSTGRCSHRTRAQFDSKTVASVATARFAGTCCKVRLPSLGQLCVVQVPN